MHVFTFHDFHIFLVQIHILGDYFYGPFANKSPINLRIVTVHKTWFHRFWKFFDYVFLDIIIIFRQIYTTIFFYIDVH